MLRKTMLGLMTVSAIALAAPSTASARGGGGFHGGGGGFHGGGFRGGGFGGGWHGGGLRRGWGGAGIGLGFGLAGAGLYGGSYGYGPYGYGGGYPYAYGGYDDEGGCFLERQRIRTPSGYRVRRVEVCR